MIEPTRTLIALENLDRTTLGRLLDAAEEFLGSDASTAFRDRLAGQAAALLFHEPSTRTRFSFELAAKRLGADVLTFDTDTSSTTKGETLADTLANLAAMGVQHFVLRHGENGIMAELATTLPAHTTLVNAGEGTHSHPTQGLLDALTIRLHRPEIERLTVAIVGDIAHSRVARSTIAALQTLGVGSLRLVGPAAFLPAPGELAGAATDNLAAGLDGADVVIALRIQRERMAVGNCPDAEEYHRRYGLNIETLTAHAKPDVLLLHPGPVNWGVELDRELARWPQSLMHEQVRHGVAVRMAVLETMAHSLAVHG
ncbi:MAG: aspartate carbamoyltransferase catalytic subunit [Gammaproteobacteria bacterium]|nr:aspartate carbamoyltransferase catalytic subunit [Gammaproteobacteria bacterium]